jgi:hypothetical protein
LAAQARRLKKKGASMISRMILPNFIVSQFVPQRACILCERSDLPFTVLAPSFAWKQDWIELNYPLRCPCGGAGHIPVQLPVLFFGFLLANVAVFDASRMQRSKATMTVQASRSSELMREITHRFRRLMGDCKCRHKCVQVGDLELWRDLAVSPHDRERFGFNSEEWQHFLRRLGFV